jgi:ribosomal protein S18 acetylase RimI-like enzyme
MKSEQTMIEFLIRPAHPDDAPGIARVHVDSWRTTYKGIIPDTILDNLSYEARTRQWRIGLSNPNRKIFDYVAVDPSDQIVGFVNGGTERSGDPEYKGELYAIYLLKEVQGQGLGRRLMLTLVERLVQEGYTNMLLWVLAANPARKFYEKMGGHVLRSRYEDFGGTMLEEVAYGWGDITKKNL